MAKWRGRQDGGKTLSLADGALEVSVSLSLVDSGGTPGRGQPIRVSVGGIRILEDFTSIEDGKRRGLEQARKVIRTAKRELDELERGGTEVKVSPAAMHVVRHMQDNHGFLRITEAVGHAEAVAELLKLGYVEAAVWNDMLGYELVIPAS